MDDDWVEFQTVIGERISIRRWALLTVAEGPDHRCYIRYSGGSGAADEVIVDEAYEHIMERLMRDP